MYIHETAKLLYVSYSTESLLCVTDGRQTDGIL